MLKIIIPPVNQPVIHVLVTHINTTGKAINDLFVQQKGTPSVSECDALLHALSAYETAVRKLRVRLAQEGKPNE